MSRELSQRLHATRDYLVAEIIIFDMIWFDKTQNHLQAEGQELFHLSFPTASSQGTQVQEETDWSPRDKEGNP